MSRQVASQSSVFSNIAIPLLHRKSKKGSIKLERKGGARGHGDGVQGYG